MKATAAFVIRAALTLLVVCVPEAARAQQLDARCTISVLNRNVQVRDDGSWVLPNIPANFGPVKARVTCIIDGLTVSGESEPFVVPPNGSVNVPKIVFGHSTPIPTSVTIAAPILTLANVGASVQLAVTGHYPGGTTQDVSAAATGTRYKISNSAIATVSADGLVQALRSGTVLVQATQEGASGMIAIQVAFSNTDTDGDGIPDEWEVAHGLNPNNALDAQEDPDHDGLTNLQEYHLGTDPHNPDTDGDGLSDGDEVNIYHTNPLLRDTDGDGIGDGLEIQTHTDPLDASSSDLAAALASLRVTPDHFVMTFNTIAGDVSRPLAVTGVMKDGGTIDLTDTARGTNYNSSDLTICSFGADSGRVFAGVSGLCTITISNSGFTATVSGEIRTFSPTPLSTIFIPGYANAVAVNGNVVYVAAGETGLQIVDVTNRSGAQIVASLDTPGNANDVKLAGTRAYVADGRTGLQIIDVANPLAPHLIGSLDTPGDARALTVAGDLIYMAAAGGGLQIIDAHTPAAPRLIATLHLSGSATAVAVSGTLAIVTTDDWAVQFVDVTDVNHPAVVGQTYLSDTPMGVVAQGTFAYVADTGGSMVVIDFSDPTSPSFLASTDQNVVGVLTGIAIADRFAAGSDISFTGIVTIVDVQTPGNPVPRATLDFRSFAGGGGIGLAMDSSYIYLAEVVGGAEKGTSAADGDSKLAIGQYRAVEDLNGIPPTATVVSPAADATFIAGETIPIAVTAVDDVGVSAVDIRVNGVAVFHDTSDPFEFSVTAPLDATSIVIGASATDIGNNVGAAPDVRVNIVPDPLTTVVGRVLDVNGQPLAGARVAVQTFSMTTGPDGRFSFDGAGTLSQSLVVSATIHVNGTEIVGTSTPTAPVRAGVTDVGDIVVSSAFVSDLGARLQCFGLCIQLPFDFPFGEGTSRRIAVQNGGSVSFDVGGTIDVALHSLVAVSQDPLSGVFVNSASSDHIVVTWNRMAAALNCDCAPPGPSAPRDTFQLILFADGLIQFAYRGMQPGYSTVGVFPPGASVVTAIDFGATPNLTIDDGESVYENFDPAANPFDLDGAIVTFAQAAGGGYALGVAADTIAPVCSVTSPASGSIVLEGEVVAVAATASDDSSVRRLRFESSGGGAAVDDSTSPYGASFVMPVGVGQVGFTVTAFDGAGNSAACSASVIVIPDPLTTVVGRVLAAGPLGGDPQPVSGASVSVLGHTATTASDGTFSLDGISTLHPVRVTATFTRSDGTLTGSSALTSPIRGGVTDTGDETAFATVFENNLGTFHFNCDDCNLTLPFDFPAEGRLWNQVSVARSGSIEFGDDGPSLQAYLTLMEANRFSDPASGVYINDQLPGRYVITWLRMMEWGNIFGTSFNPNPITAQLILFPDGRFQYGYRGVAGFGVSGEGVGLSYRDSADYPRPVDFSADPAVSAAPHEGIAEYFNYTNPIDLDNSFLTFTPTEDGGYVARYLPDTVPPYCAVVNPPNGATLFGGETLTVEARANDNMIVEHVTAVSSAGGLNIDTTKAPYRQAFTVPIGAGQITFDVTAVDRVGNIGVCSSTVSVVTGPPPTVAVSTPAASATLVEGATVRVTVNAANRVPVVRVDLVVNGVPLATTTAPPFDTLLTVPAGVGALTLSVSALDNGGQTGSSPAVNLSVAADAQTTIQGRVVDESLSPVAGAQVTATVHGASAEIFDFATSLSSLPDLTSRTPDRVVTVSAVNLRNPGLLFGTDPFGFGQSPSRAARFTTNLQSVAAGTYGFTLGVHGGGRLMVNGVTVVDVPIGTDGLFHQGSGTIAIGSGAIPIQIVAFDNGNPEIQLSYTRPGGGLEVVPPNVLVPGATPYTATSAADGSFTIANVPTILGDLGAAAAVTPPGGTLLTGVAAPVAPVGGGVTTVGDVIVRSAPADPELGTIAVACDYCDATVNIPFTFQVFGVQYPQMTVSGGGHVYFYDLYTGYTWFDVLDAYMTIDPDEPASGVYVNDTLPDRLVVTWLKMRDTQQTPSVQLTMRLTIFADGHMETSYLNVPSVGYAQLSLAAPGGYPYTQVDFSAGPTSVSHTGVTYETFDTSSNPFDLNGGFLVFTPNAAGGYDIQFVPRP